MASMTTADFGSQLAKREFEKYCMAQEIPADDAGFEQFTAYCATRHYSCEQSAFESGLAGDGGDGGIDWVYLVIDDQVVSLHDPIEEPPFPIKNKTEIKIIFGQAKKQSNWTEDVGVKFQATFSDFFHPSSEDLETAETHRSYNDNVTRCLNNIRNFWLDLAARKRPQLSIEVWYMSFADAGRLPLGVTGAMNIALDTLKDAFNTEEVTPFHAGAQQIFEMATEFPSYDSELKYVEKLETETGIMVLTSLVDYYKFLVDEDGNLRSHLFDQNVRDYQGASGEVNSKIMESLKNPSGDLDFWWLNNGITILVDDSPTSSRSILSLEDVQIVNGLQTSHTIFKFFKENPNLIATEDRLVLVRVLAPSDESHREQIIRSTNSQTPVGADALRGTDPVHRHIENILSLEGLYYDRRKNFYKNKGIPAKKIVSIRSLSQSVLSAFLLKPDTARARPSSFLKKDDDYEAIFKDRDEDDFIWAAKVDKAVEAELANLFKSSPAFRNNVRFHTLSTIRVLGNYIKKNGHVHEWKIQSCDSRWLPSEEQISSTCQWVADSVKELADLRSVSVDKIAKGPEFLTFLAEKWMSDPSIAQDLSEGTYLTTSP